MLLINPPVNLYRSARILDALFEEHLPTIADFDALFQRLMHMLSEVYSPTGQVMLNDDLVYQLYLRRPPPDSTLEALIGAAFRLSSIDLVFASDVLTDSGLLVAPGQELSITDSLTPYFKAASQLSFEDYALHILYPYYARAAPDLTFEQLVEINSLRAIEDYLRTASNVALMHNADDILLAEGDIDYLRDVFGERAQIYREGRALRQHGLHRQRRPHARLPQRPGQLLSRRRGAVLGLILLLLGGCAGTPRLPPGIAAHPELAEAVQQPSVLDVYDPLEPLNRAVYNFNAGFDRYVFLPIVRAYEFLTPDFVEDRVSDFFDNIGEIPTFANALLQLKPETAGRSATRFIVNTMFTAGLFDLAGARGVERASEDFGQTLGYWGIGRGPYLVIPVLGPSNLRDGAGIVADSLLLWSVTPDRGRRNPGLQSGPLRAPAGRYAPPHRVPLLRYRLAVRV